MITFLLTAKRKKPDSDTCWIKPCNSYKFMLYKLMWRRGEIKGKVHGSTCTNRKQVIFISLTIKSYFHLLRESSTVVTSYPHVGIGTKWEKAVLFRSFTGYENKLFYLLIDFMFKQSRTPLMLTGIKKNNPYPIFSVYVLDYLQDIRNQNTRWIWK